MDSSPHEPRVFDLPSPTEASGFYFHFVPSYWGLGTPGRNLKISD